MKENERQSRRELLGVDNLWIVWIVWMKVRTGRDTVQEGRVGACQLTNSSWLCLVLPSSSQSGSPAESTPRPRGRREWLWMTFAHVGGDHGDPGDRNTVVGRKVSRLKMKWEKELRVFFFIVIVLHSPVLC